MESNSYREVFRRYENARARYAELQEEIHQFLAGFRGEPEANQQRFSLTDLARMTGLRAQGDQAYVVYRSAEELVFRRLEERWDLSGSN